MRKAIIVTLVLVVMGVAGTRAEILEQILVKVNGEILTKTDLEARQIVKIRQQNRQVSQADLPNLIAEITPEVLEDAIDEMLLVQRGRELGYKMTDEQFKNILDNIKKENNLRNEAQFQEALRAEGMTLDDLRRSLERQMLVNRVQQTEIFGKGQLTDEEVRQYYEAHKGEFTTPASVTLREIFLAATPATLAAINERANRIRVQLAAGADFATLAAEQSEAPSRSNGGLVSSVTRSELAPELAQGLAPLKPGGLSQVLRTAKGFEILKLEAVNEPVVTPFEQVRDEIRRRMLDQRRRADLDHYVKKLRAEAVIEWKNDELQRVWVERTGGQEAARRERATTDAEGKPGQPPVAPPPRSGPSRKPPVRPKPPLE